MVYDTLLQWCVVSGGPIVLYCIDIDSGSQGFHLSAGSQTTLVYSFVQSATVHNFPSQPCSNHAASLITILMNLN